MPFPTVAVTLPEDTPPAYVTGLLSACTQAYARGTCIRDAERGPVRDADLPERSTESSETSPKSPRDAATASSGSPEAGADDSPTGEAPILASVTWTTQTTVSLLLGLPHWRDHRWLERSITFQELDQPLERHRAIGFTIGSLAGTVSEVARLEREARDAEVADAPSEQAPPESPAPPIEKPVPTATRKPEDREPLPVPLPADAASTWFVRGYLGGELGQGFDSFRRGGILGVGVYDTGWGTHLSGYYADGSGNGLEATFAGVELTLDLRVRLASVEAQVNLGGGYGLVNARVTKEQSEGFPSAVAGLYLMPADWTVAPYLGVGARVFRGFATDVPGADHLGPIAPFVQAGLILSSEPR